MITNPSIGELVDRMAVLKIKILHTRSRGLPNEHFLKEQDQAGELLGMKLWGLNEQKIQRAIAVSLELAQLHQKMWDREDDRRLWAKEQCRDGCGPHFLEEAASILEDLGSMNEKRNALRREIDEICGTFEGEEKI